MSREERRQEERFRRRARRAGFNIVKADVVESAEQTADFSAVSPAMLCSSIQLLINELRQRGFLIHDFDHKEKTLVQIQIIKGKAYFLAAEEGSNE